MSRRITLSLLLMAGALLGAVAAAPGAGPAPDRSRHLLLVPAGSAAEARMAGTRVVARYGAFTLVEAPGPEAEALERGGAERRDDMRRVALAGGAADPARRRSLAAKAGRVPPGPGLALVQFVGPLKDAWLARLRATGVRLVTYMAQNAYLVHGDGEQLERVAGLLGTYPAVRAVTPFTVADKLRSGLPRQGSARVAVQTLSGDDGGSARRRLGRSGRALRDPATVGQLRTQYLALDAAAAARIAGDPGVVSVHAAPRPRLYDERASQIVARLATGDPLVPTAPPGYFAFHEAIGLGGGTFPFSIDVTDEGIDTGVPATVHPDLHEAGQGANPTRVDYIHDWSSDPDGRDCGGHGTINASIAAGFNTATGPEFEDAQEFNYGLGVAPRVRLGGSKIFLCADGDFSLGGTLAELSEDAYAAGARISSNSWGTDNFGAYDSDSQEYDAVVRDADPGTPGNQELVEVFAAGNAGPEAGTVGSPGTAKNVITVGASEGVRASGTDGCFVTNADANDGRDVVDFSSRGPTSDGRLKPDLLAPGTHITGARPQHGDYNESGVCEGEFPAAGTLYSLSSGTSHSTPVVSGMAALVLEWYRQNEGGGSDLPSPALTKALLLNSADDLAGSNDGNGGETAPAPNGDQGWGLADLAGSLDATSRFMRDQVDVFGASGESYGETFATQDAEGPVRVTLVWTDAPGPTTGASYVNDLNLTVDAGASYKGNVLAGGQSVPGGEADTRNNVESVVLPAGVPANFSVQVTAANVAGDGVPGNADLTDQDFALVVSNAAPATAPVLGEQDVEVEDAGGDGRLEPGEDFSVSAELRNSGNAPATGVAGTLSASAGVSVADATAAWPPLAPGTTAANSDPLEGSVSAGVECGAPLGATISVTSNEGGEAELPVRIVTGAPGPAVTRASGQVPRDIPDGDSGGVQSTLSVPQQGRIKDVNVRIGSLTHTWVGDLVIDLTAPDGTTVNLANRPGGPDNDRSDLVNVVFDDEAGARLGAPHPSGAAYSGPYRPQSDDLARFDGRPQQGTWTLRVRDLIEVDDGTLNSWGHTLSPAVCAEPPVEPPAQVSGLVATAEARDVTLDWPDVPGAEGYRVFRREGAAYPALPTATTTDSTHLDPGRPPATEECYVVEAFNDAGTGPVSSDACATTARAGEPERPVLPKLDLSPVPRSLRVGRRGVFKISLEATPSKAGVARVLRHGRRLAGRRFTVREDGTARVRLKLSRKRLARLRRAGRLRTRLRVTVGELSASRRLTLKRPRR